MQGPPTAPVLFIYICLCIDLRPTITLRGDVLELHNLESLGSFGRQAKQVLKKEGGRRKQRRCFIIRPPAKEAMKYSAKTGLGGQRNPIIIEYES